MYKKLTIIVLMIVVLIPLAGVRADSMDDAAHCGDLSEADCQLVLSNIAVMDEVKAFAFALNLNIEVDGYNSADVLDLSLIGGGALEIDAETLQELNSLDSLGTDTSALLETLLTSANANMSFDLTMSGAEEDLDLEIELRLKQGILLLSANALEAFAGQSMGELEWFGLDLNGAIEDVLTDAGVAPGSDMTATNADSMEAAQAAALTITRLPDSDVNGVAVAVFESSIDIEEILSLITLEDMVALAEPGQDAEMAMAVMEQMDIRELYSRQFIGLEDHYTHRQEVGMDLTISSDGVSDADSDMTVLVDFDVNLSDFDQPVDVQIPEDAVVFPLAMMMQMGSN